MATYSDFYDTFSKRYSKEFNKQSIQAKCNENWRSLKSKFKGRDFNRALDNKIAQLKNRKVHYIYG